MTVWICNPFDILPGEDGRPMRYALLSEALARAGHEVVFWSSDFHHLLKTKRQVPSAYRHDGVDVRLVPTVPYYRNVGLGRVWSHWRFARDWRRLAVADVADTKRKPDVILCSTPPVALFKAGERLARHFNARILLDVQDVWPETFYRVLPKFLRWMGRVFFAPLHQAAQRAYRRADGVSAVSEAYNAIIRRGDVQVFPLGMKLPEGIERNATAQELRLCYVGNLGSGYCLEAVLEGMAQLIKDKKNVRLTLAGDGPKRGLVEGYASRHPQIVYQGFVNHDGLDTLLRNSDVGIVPMRGESGVAIPNKVVDYAGYGLAILNGLQGASEKALSEYDAGVMYQVNDAQSFATAVTALLDDLPRVAQIGRNARTLAEARFDAAQIYPAFAQWLEGH